MGNHKRVIITGLLMVTLIALGGGLWMAHMSNLTTRSVSAQAPQKYLAATPQNLESLGLSFTPVGPTESQAQGAIGKDQAIASALNEAPGLKAATSVSGMLGTLRDVNLQQAANQGVPIDTQLADMGLVWLVTFNGIETSSSGPGGVPRYSSNEFNVVIDAKTGLFVMAFPLYDVTPSASLSNWPATPVLEGISPVPPVSGTPSIAPTAAP
jgi:hypothetical protein